MSHFKGRDIVSIEHFTRDELEYLVHKAIEWKKAPEDDKLKRKKLAYAFFEASTRTRISFLDAAATLGMRRMGFGSAESTSLTKHESVGHTLKVLEGYRATVLVVRHKKDGTAQYAADKLSIPVINGGDGEHEHPTQTLVDLMSIQETQGKLSNLKVALVGDLKYGRTVHSLIKAMRQFDGNKFYLVHPDQLALPREYTHYENALGEHQKEDIEGRLSLDDAVKKCDIVYMTRMQLERMPEHERKQVLGSIQLKASMFNGLDRIRPTMRVLHPLPIDADNPEIEIGFDRLCPQFAYFFVQAANGLPMRELLLSMVDGAMGEDFKGKGYIARQLSDASTLVRLPVGNETKERKDYQLRPVYNGTVIDHIPDQVGFKLVRALGLDDENKYSRGRVGLAQGLSSKRIASKEIIHLNGHELSPQECNIIAMIAPGVTINIIRSGHVTDKYRTQLPDKITHGQLQCSNTNCISLDRREDAPNIFYVIHKEPAAELQCHYCDTVHSYKRGNLKTVMK